MAKTQGAKVDSLRIIHCFRSPVGGIFRHVRDLIHEQVKQGHEVGIICDNNTGGAFEEQLLEEITPRLALGLHRFSMQRKIGLGDIKITWNLYKNIKRLDVDVLHAHGAKGGAYARIIGTFLGTRTKRPARLYCPHGGSMHYDGNKLSGRIYFKLERLLENVTDRLIFVSAYERDGYFSKVGKARCPHTLARNGLTKKEFKPLKTKKNATDFLFIGMMRDLKGVDLFLNALPLVAQKTNRKITATLVGDGPDLEEYNALASTLGDKVTVKFLKPTPARKVFGMGKFLVVPSRAESMPYIVLEAIAAQRPTIATRVGGIPEIYAEYSQALVEPDNLEALATAMAGNLVGTLHLPAPKIFAERIQENFSVAVMAQDIMTAYQACIAAK
ncbi:MAG: glycosyltransferase family 4 protein [Rhizobiaceae bacterium]